MDENTILKTKDYLKNSISSIEKKISSIKNDLSYESLSSLEIELDSNWKYYEKKFFNVEKFEQRIKNLNDGEYPYDELYDEIHEYIRLVVTYHFLLDFSDEDDYV